MAQEKEIKYKFKYNGTTYVLGVDNAPDEGSSRPVASGGVFDILNSLSVFFDRQITERINANNHALPTSDAVYNEVSKMAKATDVTKISNKVEELKGKIDILNANITALLEAIKDASFVDSTAPTLTDIIWSNWPNTEPVD